jgi:hypothetical protein
MGHGLTAFLFPPACLLFSLPFSCTKFLLYGISLTRCRLGYRWTDRLAMIGLAAAVCVLAIRSKVVSLGS